MGKKQTILLLLGIVAVLYLPFVGNAFVSDDIQGLVDVAPSWTLLSSTRWPLIIHINGTLQYFIYHVFGLVPWAFRLVNILVHAGSVLLVWGIVRTLVKKSGVAIVAALLFAIHPLAIESVTWIAGGIYGLYGCFFLLSFYLYIIASKKPVLYILSLCLFLLSLCTSEKAISLALVFVVYEWFFGNLKIQWRKLIPYILLSSILILFYGLRIGEWIQALESVTHQSFSGIQNPFIQIPIAVSSYLSLFVFPVGLTLYHSEMAFTRWDFTLRAIVTLAAGMLVVYTFLKKKPIGFWLLWFVIALLPTLTPFKIGWIVAERYVYVSLVGLCVIAGILFDRLLHIKRLYIPTFLVGCIVVLFFCTQTVRRNADWVSEDSLWIATAKTSPSNPATWNNMGDVYARRGDQSQAAVMFLRAIQLNPRYSDAYHNLGHTYLLMGKIAEAKQSYEQALSLNPRLWQSYRDLAIILYKEKDVEAAKAMLSKALQIAPSDSTLLTLQELIP